MQNIITENIEEKT